MRYSVTGFACICLLLLSTSTPAASEAYPQGVTEPATAAPQPGDIGDGETAQSESPLTQAEEEAGPTETDEFVPSGQLWGYIFGDAFYKVAGENGWGDTQYAKVEKGMYAGQLRRLYLGYRYQMSRSFSSGVLLEANDGSTFANGAHGLFIKQGYLNWKPSGTAKLDTRIGLIPTPVFAFPEKAWGYRSVEKEVLDSRKIGRSVDQGVAVLGETGNGRYGYHLMVGNGSGNKPATTKHKTSYGSVFGRFFEKKLSVEAMFSYEPAADDQFIAISRLFLGFSPSWADLGASIAHAYKNDVLVTEGMISPNDLSQLAASGFARFPLNFISPKLRFFVRYDYYNPDLQFEVLKLYENPAQSYDEHLFISGLDFSPIDAVQIVPNIWVNSYSPKAAGIETRAADVVTRLTLYYRFGS